MNNKYIGILTSGGDASGMNAAIRAVTRTAIFNGFKIKGIYRGYEGLIAGEVKELTTEDVSSIIQRGGTILKTARSEAFTTPEGRKKAYEVIQKENISALIIIGGDGSLTGAAWVFLSFDHGGTNRIVLIKLLLFPYCKAISSDKHLFPQQRFVKLNKDKKGAGLGLSISQTIVAKLGGQIGANSVEGEGSGLEVQSL